MLLPALTPHSTADEPRILPRSACALAGHDCSSDDVMFAQTFPSCARFSGFVVVGNRACPRAARVAAVDRIAGGVGVGVCRTARLRVALLEAPELRHIASCTHADDSRWQFGRAL